MRTSYIHYMNKEGNKVTICLSHYAGKVVKGVATCSPKDLFDPEVGERIALARCNFKVAQKRAKRAENQVALAQRNLEAAKNFLEKMQNYKVDADTELAVTEAQLTDVELDYSDIETE